MPGDVLFLGIYNKVPIPLSYSYSFNPSYFTVLQCVPFRGRNGCDQLTLSHRSFGPRLLCSIGTRVLCVLKDNLKARKKGLIKRKPVRFLHLQPSVRDLSGGAQGDFSVPTSSQNLKLPALIFFCNE